MGEFQDRTGFKTEYFDIHQSDYSSASSKLASNIADRFDFLEKYYRSPDRIASQLNIRINNMKVGVVHFSTYNDILILNLLYIEKPCRNVGIGSYILKSFTEDHLYFICRPAPVKFLNNTSFNKQYFEIPSINELENNNLLIKESEDEEEIEKMRQFYINNKFVEGDMLASKKRYFTNYTSSIPGTFHLLQ
jgi:hypothetical protein